MLVLEQRDIDEFRDASLSGVLVGVGSLVLQFSNSTQIIMQCPFEVRESVDVRVGHGETVNSSCLLFVLLNERVDGVEVDNDSVLSMQFEGNRTLRIIPERNGLESYVVSTKHGIAPVAVI